MENSTQNEINYSAAQKRVKQLKRFYISIAIFVIVFVVYCIHKYYKTDDIIPFDVSNFSIIFWIWGLIIVVRGVKLFFFNQDWEQKMINKELSKK